LRQHAVVRRDEAIVAGVGRDAAPRRADAGIDDRDEDGARGKVLVRRRQLQRTGGHVVRWDVVRDVHQRGIGTDPENHTFHRAGVMVRGTEIGQERYDGPHVTPVSLEGFRACCF
jgi:hypothetical protein